MLVFVIFNFCAIYRNEVPENQYESLRFQIFQSIMKFSENGRPKMVLTQLCVAMVRYVFHSMPTVWPNAIVSVVHTLNSSQVGSIYNYIVHVHVHVYSYFYTY